jgi:DNA-binding IclR family transcriptional regulator
VIKCRCIQAPWGRYVLAEKSDEEITAYVNRTHLVQWTDKTRTTLEDLMSDIHAIRQEGVAFDKEENEPQYTVQVLLLQVEVILMGQSA